MTHDNPFSISGIAIIVLPDNDERFQGIPRNNVGLSMDRVIVRESEWSSLREILIAATKEKT